MKKIILLIMISILTDCSLAPKYERPELVIPPHYKVSKNWLKAKPGKVSMSRGPWWEMYHDPVLNDLEAQLTGNNQNIQAALARYEQAESLALVARSYFFPLVQGIANASRQGLSKTKAIPQSPTTFNDIVTGLNISYQLDVWGQVRNNYNNAKDLAAASAADLATIDLSMRTELAANYFTLRGLDEKQKILDATVIMYAKALYLTQQRFKGGASPSADVYQAQTQLETAKTLAADNKLNRAQTENAIAVLLGLPPAEFSLKPCAIKSDPIVVNADLPSDLLERRPDIAAAELRVEAANANIGVAKAAFFPAFNLSGGIGFDSKSLSKLIEAPSLIWALGPSSVITVFNNTGQPLVNQIFYNGGQLTALLEQAYAQYVETVANYRQTVLTAFQDVENNLIALKQLNTEYHTQLKAVHTANQSLQQSMYRYHGGLITYLEVVYSQNIALQAELNLVDIKTRQQLASVGLINALGGGWQAPIDK